MSHEELIELVKAFVVGKPDSLVVVIPKTVRERMRIEKGARPCLTTISYTPGFSGIDSLLAGE